MARLRQLTELERQIVGEYAAQHGAVLALEETIADVRGGIGAPLIRLPVLAQLERKGVIGRAEADAGDRFHALFQRGALDTLRASDMSRVPGVAFRGDLPPGGERCRRRVAEAMTALGGGASIAASSDLAHRGAGVADIPLSDHRAAPSFAGRRHPRRRTRRAGGALCRAAGRPNHSLIGVSYVFPVKK
jgi:hypothetical protein